MNFLEEEEARFRRRLLPLLLGLAIFLGAAHPIATAAFCSFLLHLF